MTDTLREQLRAIMPIDYEDGTCVIRVTEGRALWGNPDQLITAQLQSFAAWLRSEAADLRRQVALPLAADRQVVVWHRDSQIIEARALESCADKVTNGASNG